MGFVDSCGSRHNVFEMNGLCAPSPCATASTEITSLNIQPHPDLDQPNCISTKRNYPLLKYSKHLSLPIYANFPLWTKKIKKLFNYNQLTLVCQLVTNIRMRFSFLILNNDQLKKKKRLVHMWITCPSFSVPHDYHLHFITSFCWLSVSLWQV